MATISDNNESPWVVPQFNLRYGLVVLCVLSQLITVAMSWPLWQVRPSMSWDQLSRNSAIGTATGYVDVLPPAPLLPLVDLPQLPCGWLMVGSLLLVLLRPRWGVPVHTVVLLVSFVFDQYRTQPQFMANAALLWGCAYLPAREIVRWGLVSLWLWAGLHKFLSIDWMGPGSFSLVNAVLESLAHGQQTPEFIKVAADRLDPYALYYPFAIVVAAGEMLLGILAIVKPRWAAYSCVALHVGIAVFLSPWLRDWNESVIPWNLCSAAVGCWILLQAKPGWPTKRSLQFAAAGLLIYPAGFYTGWIDHGIAHVLYSDNHAIAMVTSREQRDTSQDNFSTKNVVPLPEWIDRGIQIAGFGDLRVPFPNERRLHFQYFARVGRPGEKLHIFDPRPWGGDEYFLKQADGSVLPIDAARFFKATDSEVGGVAIESWRYYFFLNLAGVNMTRRDARAPIFTAVVTPKYYQPETVENLGRLQNLEEIQLKDCPVTDADLQRLPVLYNLRGIGVRGTKVTFQGLQHLLKFPHLESVDFGDGFLRMENLRAMSALPP